MSARLPPFLVAEDDETDVFLLQRAFRSAGLTNPVRFARDGQEVQEILTASKSDPSAALPALLMLDLRRPRRDGLQTLEWIREQPWLTGLPVFVFSSSSHYRDVERAYALGASGFLVKPPSLEERATLAAFLKQWLALNHTPWHTGTM
jgi:CheY-like chemotaxis protein